MGTPSDFTLTGADAGNYTIVGATGSGTISQAAIDINAVADNRGYNGTTASTVSPSVSGTVYSPDSVTGLVQTFDSRNAGSRTLSVTGYTVNDGNGGLNYAVTTHTIGSTISQAAIDINAVADNRGYNGTTASTVSPSVSGTVYSPDSVTGLVQTFDSRNAGSRTLSVTGYTVNDGNGGLNYAVTTHTIGSTISQAAMIVNAVDNQKVADGTASAAAIPQPDPSTPIQTGDTNGFTESYGTAAADYPKVLTPTGVVNDGNGGGNYAYTYNGYANGRIRPGAVDSLQFTAQPIDTKVLTPIYDSCVPGGTPCAGSSAAVQVTAYDHFGNRAGPGAPGADSNTAAITIYLRQNTNTGTFVGHPAGYPTSDGRASFGSDLTAWAIGTSKLYAATGTGQNAAPNKSSNPFQIVNELATCRSALCKNNVGNNGGNNALQYLYGQITSSGTYTATTLTTQFVAGSRIDHMCGNNVTVNQGVELRAAGTDVNTTSTGYMVIIIPKNTLKADGVLSRGTPSFNVCLGTIYLGDGTLAHPYGSATSPWTTLGGGHANPTTDSLVADGDSYVRYWGTPGNCGATSLHATDPCIYLRTKQKADITALINQHILSAGADTNMHDGDLAIVIKKPSPWDGKGGVYN